MENFKTTDGQSKSSSVHTFSTSEVGKSTKSATVVKPVKKEAVEIESDVGDWEEF